MRIALAQINPTVGDLIGNVDIHVREWQRAEQSACDLILFPELSLTGYFPEDLLYRPAFICDVKSKIDDLVLLSKGLNCAAIIGAPYFDETTNALFNAVYCIQNGNIVLVQYKYNLPNYGVFDEKRYFSKPKLPNAISLGSLRIGLLICEDFWETNVSSHLIKQDIDFFIVINASPYLVGKIDKRILRARHQINAHKKSIIYLNQIGGQDDLVFDGSSFVMDDTGKIIHQMKSFETDISIIDFENNKFSGDFTPHMPINDHEEFYRACVLATRDYLQKTHTKQVLIGLSGGIDSGIVAAIAVDAIGSNNVFAVMMPSEFTSTQSLNDAEVCAKNLNIDYKIIPITNMMREFEQSLAPLIGLAHENMQSRLRANILMSLSNQTGRMVLTTGNKSEMAMGYATLYGDMCGGYNPIKDLYKTQIFALANWRNKNYHENFMGHNAEIIPQSIITKPPSAELRAGQTDQDSLPPYEILDVILHGLIELDVGIKNLIAEGHDPETVRKIQKSLLYSEYKRKQSPPGAKISTKAFTRERRFPIVNGYKETE
jgi:NAD+ synthase